MKRIIAFAILFSGISLFLAGCASTDPYADSSIPWNAPQSWEGSPGIPGLEAR